MTLCVMENIDDLTSKNMKAASTYFFTTERACINQIVKT